MISQLIIIVVIIVSPTVVTFINGIIIVVELASGLYAGLVIILTMKCSRCGYQWESKVPNPKECPRCKSRLDYVSMPVGAPKIKFEKKEVSKAMTSKISWVAAAAIIVVAAVGAWTILGTPAAPSGETGVWNGVQEITPGSAYGIPAGSKSGITAVHFMKHGIGYDNSENLQKRYNGDNDRIGSFTASGQTLGTFPFDTRFDIVVDVVGNDDNMGQVNIGYLMVELGSYKNTGWQLLSENSVNTREYTYSSPASYLFVNALWDNNGEGYTISADDNMILDNIRLWLRG